MTRHLGSRLLLPALAIAVLGACLCAPPVECSAECNGCCDSGGRCLSGRAPTACGANGSQCRVCSPGVCLPSGDCGAADAAGGTGGSGGAGGDSGDAGGGSGGGIADVVTGHRNLFYRLETADLIVADPTPVYLHVPLGDGGFSRLATTSLPDGGFWVAGVPPGDFYVQVGDTWLVTSARDVSLDDHTLLGRPGTLGGPCQLKAVCWVWPTFRYSLTGLTASPSPFVGFTTPNTGTFGRGNADTGTSMLFGGLPNGVSSDTTWVWQFLPGDAGVLPDDGGMLKWHWTAENGGAISGLTLTSSGGTLTAALAPLPQTAFSTTIRSNDFARFAADVSSSATVDHLTVLVTSTPTPPGAFAGSTWDGAILLDYAFEPGAADLPLTLSHGSPFPSASWTTEYEVYGVFFAPNAVREAFLALLIADRRPQAPTLFAPRLSPPRDLTIDGVAARGSGHLSRLTPLLAWSPPRLGTPSGYAVRVYRLGPPATLVATLWTQSASVWVPPGVLASGSTYMVKVTAYFAPLMDWRAAPLELETSFDLAWADALSGAWLAP